MTQLVKFKYKKPHKGRMNTTIGKRSTKLVNGNIGIISKQAGILYPFQLNTLRNALKRKLKKKGKIWFRVSPNHAKTKKPIGVRMGKGKGSISKYFCFIRPLQIICEFRIGRLGTIRLAEIAYQIKNKIHLPTALVYTNHKKTWLARKNPLPRRTMLLHTKFLLKKRMLDFTKEL